MTAEWEVRTLSDVCTIRPPKAEARKRLAERDEVSFVPMEDLGIDQKTLMPTQARPLFDVAGSYTYFADGDVLLAKITPCFENGKLGIAAGLKNGVGFGSSEFMVFRPCDSLSREWLYYYLSRESFRQEGAERMTGAVGHKRVSKEFIEEYPIPVPPLDEQKRIVAILDEAFEGIATAKANAEKSLQGSQDLFDGYLESVFSTGIGDWPTRSLGEICGFEGGSQPPKSEFIHSPRDGYVRFIQIRDFGSDKNITYIPVSKKNRLCEREDILIGRYGASVGKILTGLAGAYNVALIKTSPDPRLLDRDYFYQYLKSRAFQVPLMRVAARSAQDGFSKEDISGFAVPLPSLSVQRAVVGRIGPLSTDVRRVANIYEQKLAALDDLKKSLLHHAFSGQL